MTSEKKDEVLQQIRLDVRMGFENEEEIYESIQEMFEDEEGFDEKWLRQAIAAEYKKHQDETWRWDHPTDFDRLARAFDELITQDKIVCLHNAGYTLSDAESDCIEVIEELKEVGVKAIGYCFYHAQDLERAIDPEQRNLYLGFDTPTQDDKDTLKVARKVVDKLKQHNFQVSWPGNVKERIKIENIDWKKVPDDEDWGGGRVVDLLADSEEKPFWKFW